MKKTFTQLFLLLCGLLTVSVQAQVSRGGVPLSFEMELPAPPVVQMPAIDLPRLQAEDSLNDQLNVPLRFAYGFSVVLNLDNAGSWVTLPNGDRIWRLRIDCPTALSVNLLYDDFYLPPGSAYFLYRPDRREVLGAFGYHNNRDSRRFATALIHDESVILEYYEPAAVRGQGVLSISQVSHGYRLISDLENSEGLNDAGNCQVNVNCSPEGDNWQLEKKAVARIIMDGIALCTGSLINNSANDCKPYFLTANHCIDPTYDAVTNPNAANFVFYWNYERSGCPNTGSVPSETTVGATVRANTDVSSAASASDFALLELTTNPGDFYDVYYAGFDASGDPGTGGVGIHHPAGDAKKIATHSITPASVVSDRYWRIYWDQTPNGWSVTEGGSSGSPLFNSDKRIIGQLFGGFLGGQPNCSDPANDEGDYGKLSYSWDNAGAADSRRRLRDWLDPVGNGAVTAVNGAGYPCNDCMLTSAGLQVIGCDDNGTPNDDTDDFISFSLHPTGDNLGAGYTVTGPGIVPAGGTYGTPVVFHTNPGTAGGGDLTLQITDSDNGGCLLSFTVADPGSCLGAGCAILDAGLTGVQCDDNGTPDDPSDDRVQFQLTVTGVNTGNTYNLRGMRFSSTTGQYGVPKVFFTSAGTAGAGAVFVEIIDSQDPSCTLVFLLEDPGTCSGQTTCDLMDAGLSGVQCDDNGTPGDPADDFISFSLHPTGNGLGSGYAVAGAGVTPPVAVYGQATTFVVSAGSAGAGDLSLTITDLANPGCSLAVIVSDPGACSATGSCSLLSAGLSNIQCNDNGTPADPADDFIVFDLNPDGDNLASGYLVSGPGVTPVGGSYGTATTFSTPAGSAGAGDLALIITDEADPACLLDIVVADPGTCSQNCDLVVANYSGIQCNDNGTPDDSADDFLTFNLNPQGTALGATYTVSGAGILTQSAAYGAPVAFSSLPGTADGADLLLTLSDDEAPACQLTFLLPDPGSCSAQGAGCGLDEITCQAVSVALGPDGTVQLDLNSLVTYPPGCDYLITLISPRTPLFDCDDLGDNAVLIRIRDGEGNSEFCSAVVTVTDPSGFCNEGESGTLLSLTGSAAEDGFRVFPVPAHDLLTVAFERVASEDGLLILADQFGRVLRTWKAPAGQRKLTLPVSDLPGGVYYLRYRMKTSTVYQKVMIAR